MGYSLNIKRATGSHSAEKKTYSGAVGDTPVGLGAVGDRGCWCACAVAFLLLVSPFCHSHPCKGQTGTIRDGNLPHWQTLDAGDDDVCIILPNMIVIDALFMRARAHIHTHARTKMRYMICTWSHLKKINKCSQLNQLSV